MTKLSSSCLNMLGDALLSLLLLGESGIQNRCSKDNFQNFLQIKIIKIYLINHKIFFNIFLNIK